MSKKLITIAGIVFALSFAVVFITIWMSTQAILNREASDRDSLFRADLPFDTSLFDNRVVTGESLINLLDDLTKSGNVYSAQLKFKRKGTSRERVINEMALLIGTEFVIDREYRCQIVANSTNGVRNVLEYEPL